jgi:hypothetical protein
MRFEVSMGVRLYIIVFLMVMECSLVDDYQLFRIICLLNLLGRPRTTLCYSQEDHNLKLSIM